MALAKNSVEGKAETFLKRIESLHSDLDTLRGEYMNECKGVREDMKEVYQEAKDAGVPVRALKGLVRYRKLERDQEKIKAGLDEDEQGLYENLVEALGELGAAAAKKAGYTVADTVKEGDEHIKEQAERLAQVGRGNGRKDAKPAAPAGDAVDTLAQQPH